jgi:bifunctional non-homologous end joining protein LigD
LLKNLDKVLYPIAGFTKGDVIAYYRAVSAAVLPHLAGRAVTLARFPDGVDRPGWYQSNCPRGAKRTVEIRAAKSVRYCLIEDEEALVWAANLGAIEFHPFLARAVESDRPHALVVDLDPGPPSGLRECCAVAQRVREALHPRDCFVKTSGAKGLHVYVPLNGTATYADTKAFARDLALRWPDLATDKQSREARAGKVMIDWRQNDANRSTIAAWSLRATRVPLVSTPLRWEELEHPEALAFTPQAALGRLRSDGDLFAPVLRIVQRL